MLVLSLTYFFTCEGLKYTSRMKLAINFLAVTKCLVMAPLQDSKSTFVNYNIILLKQCKICLLYTQVDHGWCCLVNCFFQERNKPTTAQDQVQSKYRHQCCRRSLTTLQQYVAMPNWKD